MERCFFSIFHIFQENLFLKTIIKQPLFYFFIFFLLVSSNSESCVQKLFYVLIWLAKAKIFFSKCGTNVMLCVSVSSSISSLYRKTKIFLFQSEGLSK